MKDKNYSYTIEVVYPDGRHMTAWLGKTDVNNENVPILQNTVDPNWHAQEAGHGEEQGEWLPYVTWSGSHSRTKAHCQYNVAPPGPGAGPYIYTQFEHRDLASDTEDPDDAHKRILLFKDWEGAVWKATVQNVQKPFPAQPIFYLERQ